MLWVFGDSFSVPREYMKLPTHPLWTELVTEGLKEPEIRYCSQWGVSNEWIINELMTKQSQFEVGDKVILQLTSPDRQWFFEDNPSIGNFFIEDLDHFGNISKAQTGAIKSYITHLNSDHLTRIRSSLYHLGVERITQILNWVQILVLPGWTDISGVNGKLMDICNGEFETDQARVNWYDHHKIDPRPNHMSKNNHRILSNKIVSYFTTGQPIDLQTGFEKGFIK